MGSDLVTRLRELKALLDCNVLTQDEFTVAKSLLLSAPDATQSGGQPRHNDNNTATGGGGTANTTMTSIASSTSNAMLEATCK